MFGKNIRRPFERKHTDSILAAVTNINRFFSLFFSGYKARMYKDEAPAASHRVQILPDHAGWGGDPHDQVVRVGRRL